MLHVAFMSVAREVQWWDLEMPVHYKLVNRRNSHAKIIRGHSVAYYVIALLNTQEVERIK